MRSASKLMPAFSDAPEGPKSDTAMVSRRVVVIGGGTGSFQVLSGLRAHHPHLALQSIVTTLDSGGDSGSLAGEETTP